MDEIDIYIKSMSDNYNNLIKRLKYYALVSVVGLTIFGGALYLKDIDNKILNIEESSRPAREFGQFAKESPLISKCQN